MREKCNLSNKFIGIFLSNNQDVVCLKGDCKALIVNADSKWSIVIPKTYLGMFAITVINLRTCSRTCILTCVQNSMTRKSLLLL